MSVQDDGPFSSLTIDAMRAESSWVSVTGACLAEGGVDGGPSPDLDPRVALSILFPRQDVREVRPPRGRRHDRVHRTLIEREKRVAKVNVAKVKLLPSSTNPGLAVLARV